MIDTDVMQGYIRDANPIPTLDDLDPDELTAFVTVARTRRAAIMQAPTQHSTRVSPVTPPPQRRRRAWAFAAGFVVILLLVGAAAVLLRSDTTPVADEPATPPTTSSPEVATSPPATISPEAAIIDGWQQVATGEMWALAIRDVEALPDGGYVATISLPDDVRASGAAGTDVSSVMWSPNGVDWFDGDPQRNVPHRDFMGASPQIAVAGDAVFVVDTEFEAQPPWVDDDIQSPWVADIALWMGDPKRGTWDRLDLDVAAVDGHPVGTTQLASNGDKVLVSSYVGIGDRNDLAEGLDTEIVVWIIDPLERSYLRTSIPNALTLFPNCTDDDLPCPGDLGAEMGFIGWVDHRWIHFAGTTRSGSTLWTSGDGQSWSEITLPPGMRDVLSIAAGSSGVVATTCDPDHVWFSPDGLEWTVVRPDVGHSWVIASLGERGFVLPGSDSGPGVDLVANDGSGVGVMPSPFGGAGRAAASGDTLLVLSVVDGLWLYQDVNG